MSQALGMGTTLEFSEDSGSNWTSVGQIVDTIDNEVSVEEGETTLLGDTYKSYLPADIDPGELSFSIALDNDDSTNQNLVDLLEERTVVSWRVTYPNSTTADVFNGFVKSLSRTVAKRSMLVRNVGIRLTGDPGLTGTSGGGSGA